MSQNDEREEKRGFKVEDRRRFSETGEARPEQPNAPEPVSPPEPAAAAAAPASTGTGDSAPDSASAAIEINFSTFIISLSTQALAHLGEIPHPIDNQIVVDLAAARQLIDILGLLQDKTKGNLDKAEAGLLQNILYDLRLRFVERARGSSQAPGGATR